MSFNKTKWKVLPLSHNNPIQKKRKSNWLGEEQLETLVEKTWGCWSAEGLAFGQEGKEANGILAYISSNVASRAREKIIPLSLELVSLHLKSCVQFWGPNGKDTGVQEWVQRTEMRLVKTLEHKVYQEWLRLFRLEKSRLRGDVAVF